jgi:hypothetical protein
MYSVQNKFTKVRPDQRFSDNTLDLRIGLFLLELIGYTQLSSPELGS